MDYFDVVRIVNLEVDKAGSQTAFAEKAGVSRQALSDQLNAKKPFSNAVLKAAGIRRKVVTTFELIGGGNDNA